MSLLEIKNSRIFYFICLIPFLLVSIFSEGFLHPDEHYQILELLNLKIGNVKDYSIFNWDYHLHIRSWFQVGIYYLLAKLSFLENPFQLALLIRFFNSLLGFISVLYLSKFLFKNEKLRRISMFLTSFTWFVPYIFARTSSESLSTSLFFIALVLFFKEKKSSAVLSGLLFGASFACRFQMGIPVFFAFLWSAIYKKNYKFLWISLFSTFGLVAINILVDWWGYDKWVFSPYNYLMQNIVENKASEFGVSPFWYYIFKPWIKAVPPLTLFYLFSFLVLWFKKTKSILTYVTLSFFVIHSAIGHKEIRFLNFLYVISPMIMVYVYDSCNFSLNNKILKLFKFSFAINILILLKICLTPAHSGLSIYKYLYNKSYNNLFVIEKNERKFELTMPFYQKQSIKTKAFTDTSKGMLITTKYNEYQDAKTLKRCKNIFLSYPQWVFNFNIGNWLSRSGIYSVFDCQ